MRTPAKNYETNSIIETAKKLTESHEALSKAYQGLSGIFLDPEATVEQTKVAAAKAQKILAAQYKVRAAIEAAYEALDA